MVRARLAERCHVEREPPRPSEVEPLAGIPASFDDIVSRALAKRPAERFESAIEFDRALVQALRAAGADPEGQPECAGSLEVQASLAAWAAFAPARAKADAARAIRLNRAWSPLALLLDLVPEE